jgi:homoserine O-acetyltransferase/O-succinyltransferase
MPRPIAGAATLASLALAVMLAPAPASGQELRLADLGACALESGESLDPCHLGYRIVGTPAADGSNVVVLGTWFGGTSEHLVELIGSGGAFPTADLAYVVVDAPANGVSISPSNSPTQAGAAFPEITVGDMAAMHHRVAAEHLGLRRVLAVGGISMGGMTALQWALDRPGYMDRAFSIAGTPWISESDRTLWGAFRAVVRIGAAWIDERTLRALGGLLGAVAVGTDGAEAADWADFLRMLGDGLTGAASAADWSVQLGALLEHDIARGHPSREAAARGVDAELMLVVGPRDGVVDPRPSAELADLAGGRLVELDPRCGHAVHLCDGPGLRAAMADFLGRPF